MKGYQVASSGNINGVKILNPEYEVEDDIFEDFQQLKLTDFDDHFENPMLDWRNPDFN